MFYQKTSVLVDYKNEILFEEFFFRIIMVVGAGRGPLVNRALEAADRAKYKVHIYAVEKNPMAIIS
jgi:protein arginine N-methyltransferase 5